MKSNRLSLRLLYKILTVVLSLYWIVFSCNFAFSCLSKNYFYPVKFKEQVLFYSNYFGLDKMLVFSVINVESGFDDKALSRAGAIGLMQITEETAQYIAKLQKVQSYSLTDPETNIAFGCFYLKYLISKFEVLDTSLCAYNAGEGKVNVWLNNPDFSKDKKTLVHIPYKETAQYLNKIHKNLYNYNKLYGHYL